MSPLCVIFIRVVVESEISKDVGIISQFIGLAYKFAANNTPNDDDDGTLVTLKGYGQVGHYCAWVSSSTALSFVRTLAKYALA